MPNSSAELAIVETVYPDHTTAEPVLLPESVLLAPEPTPALPKEVIRSSLRASTWDGVFATIFSNIAGGVLLSNFLVELNASPTQVGMLSSIPMLVNLLQPLGAYLGDRMTSRHFYCLWIYLPSRLLWLVLALGIAASNWYSIQPSLLVNITLAIVLLSHLLGAFGSAAWLSWLAALVPKRLRGRYFGLRNSAASLTNLLCVPLMGLAVSQWWGGSVQGYGVVLLFGIVTGVISLAFQHFMVDVNPQVQKSATVSPQLETRAAETTSDKAKTFDLWQDTNFLVFLLYFALWSFAVNLSNPFFNLYLLDNLSLNVTWVTIYNSLAAGANLLMLLLWGRIADRVGNRPLLVLVGIAVAVIPLFWLGVGVDTLSLWLWLPLLHISASGFWAAIDLCSNNIQLSIAPVRHHATYFAIAAAVAGVSGALGTTAGGLLAQFADYGGLPGLFALSSVVRLLALLPLLFVHEQRARPIRRLVRSLLPIAAWRKTA